MPEDLHEEKRKTIDDYLESVESSRYYHDLYLKAVNHPIRRAVLKYIHKHGPVSKKELASFLNSQNLLEGKSNLTYHLDFLQKSLCIETITQKKDMATKYQLRQAGKVIEFLK